MQLSFIISAAAAVSVAAATKLPSTVTLYVNQLTTTGTTQIGCVNGYGNFTRNMQWCQPFRNFYTTGDDSTLKGYQNCIVYPGVLDCNTANGSPLGSFTQSGNYLAIDNSGAISSDFSISSFPNATDRVGVPIVIGNGGSYSTVKISVKSTQG